MKRLAVLTVVLALFVLVAAVFFFVAAFEPQSSSAEPKKMAQKIAKFVAKNGGEARFFKGNVVYQVSVWRSRPQRLLITYYHTNRAFPRKSVSDEVADTLIHGVPQIVRELHLSDDETDGTPNMFQEFSKAVFSDGPNVYPPFTREERDLKKRDGVKERLVHGGKTFKGNKWVEVPEDEKARIQKEYEFHLAVLVKLISRRTF